MSEDNTTTTTTNDTESGTKRKADDNAADVIEDQESRRVRVKIDDQADTAEQATGTSAEDTAKAVKVEESGTTETEPSPEATKEDDLDRTESAADEVGGALDVLAEDKEKESSLENTDGATQEASIKDDGITESIPITSEDKDDNTIKTKREDDKNTSGSEEETEVSTAVKEDEGSDEIVEEHDNVPRHYVGRIIGKGGEMIRDLQARSGCKIGMDQKNLAPNQPVKINYRGTSSAIKFAKELIAMLCTDDGKEVKLPLGSALKKDLQVPSNVIGKVIGRGGEMIREIQTRSMCKIQVEHNNKDSSIDPTKRVIHITGSAENVKKAEDIINYLSNNPQLDAMAALNIFTTGVSNPAPYGGSGSSDSYKNSRSHYSAPYGATETDKVSIERQFVGRIIGSKGITINDLQKRSGCDMQVDQSPALGQYCFVSIKGHREGIEMAKQMIDEIINMGPSHSYAGGASHGIYNQGGYEPQNMGMQQQFQNGLGGGYNGGGVYGGNMKGFMQPPYMQQPQPYQQQFQQSYQYHQPQPGYSMPMQYSQQQAFPVSYGNPPPPPPVPVLPMPSPWKSATASDGKTYYYNEKTGETQWEKPAGMP